MLVFTTKDGREIEVRPIRVTDDDTRAASEYINQLVAEDVMISQNERLTFEDEAKWVRGQVNGMAQKTKVQLSAFYQGKMIGATAIERRHLRSKHIGDFHISVASDFRGQGLGRFLMTHILEQAVTLGITRVFLAYFALNEPAFKLYSSLGFTQTGLNPGVFDYHGQLVDEIMMTKLL